MGYTSTPDFSGYLNGVWAWPVEFDGYYGIIAAASNVVVGTNPPYSVTDFLTIFPIFGGAPLTPTATLVQDSASITVSSGTGIAVGNPITGNGIPDGTTVIGVSGMTVTLSAEATSSGSDVALTIWNALQVPLAVLNAFLYLASSSLVYNRWLGTWTYAMALYVAHFATLWLRSQNSPVTPVNPLQIVAQGLALGIQTSKAVHDVSVSYQVIGDLVSWGSWNLTLYGQELVGFAMSMGAGPMLIW